MAGETQIPEAADVIVVGGGTAGAIVAGAIAERSDASVVLVEAGPDYGPADSGRWPQDLLDAATLAMASHDWDLHGNVNGRRVDFNRAKVIGGCSSHNGGAAVRGSRVDYDRWAAAGNPGWTTEELLPLFASAFERFRVRPVTIDDLTPFQRACADGLAAAGIPIVDDFDDIDEPLGTAPFAINIEPDGRRINSAFAYLDPVREKGNLTILGDAEVERVLLDGPRAVGVVFRADGEEVTMRGERIVLSGGAYESPAVLQRSGIGDAEQLRGAGIEVAHELPGVGENLHDQPTFEVDYTGSDELLRVMTEYAEDRWRPDEQVIAKFPSSECTEGWDLHIYPLGGRDPLRPGAWRWTIAAAVLTPLSRGNVVVNGSAAADGVSIDHRFLSDPGGSDLRRLVEAVVRIREAASEPRLAALLGEELRPGRGLDGVDGLTEAVASSVVHYWHPAGSCKMGPAHDPLAVVDADGRVHGLEGLFVADASIMPSVMSGNTNMPTAVIGERMGRAQAAA
jgi:choline dehydrogenase-like flavoprotein